MLQAIDNGNAQVIRRLLGRRLGESSQLMFDRLLKRCKTEGELVKQCTRWILSREERERFLNDLKVALPGNEWAPTMPTEDGGDSVPARPVTTPQTAAQDSRWVDTATSSRQNRSRFPETAIHVPHSLERVTQIFTEYMGPIARIIITKATEGAGAWDYAELVNKLALQLDNSADRNAFKKKCLAGL
jgi:hypothetical protein